MRIASAVMSTLLASSVALVNADHSTAQDIEPHNAIVHGEFAPYRENATAITYRPDLVPPGAWAHVISVSGPLFGSKVTLALGGLVPSHHYGAHVHTKPCGATGDAAGPHYQHVIDPNTPSVDPKYANPSNEIWLDFAASDIGTGLSTAEVGWQFDPSRRPGSVVIHQTHTHTGHGQAGTAGARLACINVNF